MELASFGNKKSYDDFKQQIPKSVFPLFDSVRSYCFSLGDNVVEDIRMHRIVFGKSMTFRWFADVVPQENSILIKIQKSRKEDPQIMEINLKQDLTQVKKNLSEAYNLIK